MRIRNAGPARDPRVYIPRAGLDKRLLFTLVSSKKYRIFKPPRSRASPSLTVKRPLSIIIYSDSSLVHVLRLQKLLAREMVRSVYASSLLYI